MLAKTIVTSGLIRRQVSRIASAHHPMKIHRSKGDFEQCPRDRRSDAATPMINVNDVPHLALAPFMTRDCELTKPDRGSLLLGNPDVSILWLTAPFANCPSDEGFGFSHRVRSPCLVSADLYGRCPLVDGSPVLDVNGAQRDTRHRVIRLTHCWPVKSPFLKLGG